MNDGFKESVVFGNEEDISSRLDTAKSGVYTLPLGVMYEDNSAGVAFNFRDAIIEYRPNIGIPSTKQSSISGRPTNYGVTYMSVGIPLARYKWLKDDIEEVTGVPLEYL